MKMEFRALFRWIVLFLAFSFALSRSLNLKATSDHQPIREMHNQGKHLGFWEENEFHWEGRMDIEFTDYSGTGANNHHDPKPPGALDPKN